MAIKIGDVDLANELVNNEFRLANLEKILEFILNNNQGKIALPNQQQITEIGRQSLIQLKSKYPNMGLELDSK